MKALAEIAIKDGRIAVGSILHLFSKKLKNTVRASEVNAALKHGNPKLFNKELKVKVNEALKCKTTLEQAISQVRISNAEH